MYYYFNTIHNIMGSPINEDDIKEILINIDINKSKKSIIIVAYVLFIIINICIIIMGIKTFFLH